MIPACSRSVPGIQQELSNLLLKPKAHEWGSVWECVVSVWGKIIWTPKAIKQDSMWRMHFMQHQITIRFALLDPLSSRSTFCFQLDKIFGSSPTGQQHGNFSFFPLAPASDIQRYTASVQGSSIGCPDLSSMCLPRPFPKSLPEQVTLTLLVAVDFILNTGYFFLAAWNYS